MSDAFDLSFLLTPAVRAKMSLVDKVKLLFDQGMPVVGSPDGWSVFVVETDVKGLDFEDVVEQALAVLATHHPPWAEAS